MRSGLERMKRSMDQKQEFLQSSSAKEDLYSGFEEQKESNLQHNPRTPTVIRLDSQTEQGNKRQKVLPKKIIEEINPLNAATVC
jgi:hypothetical protein